METYEHSLLSALESIHAEFAYHSYLLPYITQRKNNLLQFPAANGSIDTVVERFLDLLELQAFILGVKNLFVMETFRALKKQRYGNNPNTLQNIKQNSEMTYDKLALFLRELDEKIQAKLKFI